MKPKFEEVRRILNLALGCWTDFLNELNNLLFSKSYLPDQSFLEMVYGENPRDEIREAIFLINCYWNRLRKKVLSREACGLSLSKPHAVYLAETFKKRRLPAFSVTPMRIVSHEINQVEIPVWFKKFTKFSILRPSKEIKRLVSDYGQRLINARTYPDPYVRAGIDLRLIERGFKL